MAQAKEITNNVISPKFSMALQRRMLERGLNARELSRNLRKAYDHVRKVYNGNVFPGPSLLEAICNHLNLDYEEMTTLVNADRAVFKGLEFATTGRDPHASMIEGYFKYLTKADKDEMLAMVKLKAEHRMINDVHAGNGTSGHHRH